jgi:toxin YoeB
MELVWKTHSWENYCYWQKNDKKILQRINDLIKDCMRNLFNGIGKPELLKGNFSGCWSKWINDEYRLVYAIRENWLHILQCRFHYT